MRWARSLRSLLNVGVPRVARNFEITVQTPLQATGGASLQTVVTKLDGLLRLHLDSGSALLRPGARRVRISNILANIAAIRVVRADPARSLSIALHIPDVPADYIGDHAATLRRIEPAFVQTLEAGASRDLAQVRQLYPERV